MEVDLHSRSSMTAAYRTVGSLRPEQWQTWGTVVQFVNKSWHVASYFHCLINLNCPEMCVTDLIVYIHMV